MLAYRDFDIGLCGNAKKSLPDRDRLLRRIEPDFEYLLWPFELTDESLELALLLFTLAGCRAQLAGPLTSFVHERRIGLPNCDHFVPLSKPRTRDVVDRPTCGRWPIDYTLLTSRD